MRRIPAALAALAGMLAVSGSAAAAVHRAPCETVFDVPKARCGTITVPLDRSGAVEGQVRLFAELVRSPRRSSSAAVVFPGGPGAATTPLARTLRHDLRELGRDHDLLFFDQRGTGRSSYLDCDVALTPTYFVPPGGEAHQIGKTAERCATKLGARRGFYNARDTADDLEALRQALKLDKLLLFGISYGTRDALAYAEAYPEHVDRIVLDSVVTEGGLDPFGLNRVRALPRVLRALCRGGGCDGFTSDPVADLEALVARLAQGPLRAKRVVTLSGCRARPAIMRSRLFALIQQADIDPELLAELPVAIAEAAKGRPYQLSELEARSSLYLSFCAVSDVLERIITDARGRRDDIRLLFRSFSPGNQVARMCEETPFPWPRDSLPSARQALAEQALWSQPEAVFAPLDRPTVLASSLVPICKFWMAASAPPAPVGLHPPRVPMLILAGLDDLRTPAEDARELAASAPWAHLLLVPDVGHSVYQTSGCARRAFAHFVADEPIGECHRRDQHSPEPQKRVKTLQQQLDELLEAIARG